MGRPRTGSRPGTRRARPSGRARPPRRCFPLHRPRRTSRRSPRRSCPGRRRPRAQTMTRTVRAGAMQLFSRSISSRKSRAGEAEPSGGQCGKQSCNQRPRVHLGHLPSRERLDHTFRCSQIVDHQKERLAPVSERDNGGNSVAIEGPARPALGGSPRSDKQGLQQDGFAVALSRKHRFDSEDVAHRARRQEAATGALVGDVEIAAGQRHRDLTDLQLDVEQRVLAHDRRFASGPAALPSCRALIGGRAVEDRRDPEALAHSRAAEARQFPARQVTREDPLDGQSLGGGRRE